MLQRRKFLERLGLGIAGLSLFSFRSNAVQTKLESMQKIKKIRALGFQWETNDPFLFCVHHEDIYPKGNEQLGPDPSYFQGRHMGQDFIVKDGFRMYHGTTVPGFPGHPHRGFETITVVRKGMIDHADSTGAAGRYGNGDVQWMTAGKGVQHSEMFPLLNKEAENPTELFQIWLNLPAKSKMVEPHFRMIWAEEVPKITFNTPNSFGVEIEVIVGELNGAKCKAAPPDSWAAVPENEVGVFHILLKKGAEWTLPATENEINRSIYFYDGKGLLIENQQIPEYHAVDVVSNQALILSSPDSETKILILQGKPINEPVVQHGPFVMNTREEIYQAFQDYQTTQFGGWPWTRYDHVHDANVGRFAKYTDGEIETKDVC